MHSPLPLPQPCGVARAYRRRPGAGHLLVRETSTRRAIGGLVGWLLAGLFALGALAACGGGDDQPGAPTGAPTAASPTGAAPTTPAPPTQDLELIEIAVSGGEVDPPPGRIDLDQGATVRIVVTSDQPDEIHLHGYELVAGIGPGQDGVLEFVADQAGLFELETHEQGLVLVQLAVQ